MTLARTAALITLVLATAVDSVLSRDIHVPGEAATLRSALLRAEPGDRVVLAPGRYLENDLSLRESVTVLGNSEDPGTVVIDGRGLAAVFRAEGLQFVHLVGLTVTGGLAAGSTAYAASGGALLVSHANVRLEHVHFRGNRALASGGAVRVGRGELVAVACVFDDNHALKGGGAVDLSYETTATIAQSRFVNNSAAWGGAVSARTISTCAFDDCELSGNTTIAPQDAGGAFFSDYAADVRFTNCVFSSNTARRGGAGRLQGAETSFANCTAAGNVAWEAGGALMVSAAQLFIDRSIISFNHGTAISGEVADLQCEATNIFGNLGGDWTGSLLALRHQDDNMASDPLFCATGDLRLQEESPCAPGNNPVGLIGARPVGCENVRLTLSAFTAEREQDRIVLAWTATPGGFEFRLQGRALADSSGPTWTVPHVAGDAPGRYLASDDPPASSGPLLYLLDAREPDGAWFRIGEKQVEGLASPPSAMLTLDSVYPNPFNPLVNIRYTLTRAAPVRAAIYDLSGRLVALLAAGSQPEGTNVVAWDGRDLAGRPQPTGAYLLHIESDGVQCAAKLLLVK